MMFRRVEIAVTLLAAMLLAGCEPSVLSISSLRQEAVKSEAVKEVPRKPAGCKVTSECLLAFGLDAETNETLGPGMGVLKVDDAAPVEFTEMDKVLTDFKGNKTELAELEMFLDSYEPSTGMVGKTPPLPERKLVSRASLQKSPVVSSSERIVITGKGQSLDVEGAAVHKLRLGEHPRYTRIVLDLSKEAKVEVHASRKERMLFVDLPGTAWETEEKWYSTTPPLVMAYLAKPLEGGGTRLVVRLKEEASVLHEEFLPAGDYPWYRVIIDLQSPLAHKL